MYQQQQQQQQITENKEFRQLLQYRLCNRVNELPTHITMDSSVFNHCLWTTA
jgi:hypothetical protein